MAEAATLTKPQIQPAAPERIAINFELDGKLIDSASIRPPTFANFCECIAGAHAMTTPPSFAARLLRQRMSKMVVYYAGGTR